MSFNKKLVIIASVLIFGQAAAMKRPSDEIAEVPNKRLRRNDDKEVVLPHIEDKFRSSLHSGNVGQASKHLEKMLKLESKDAFVSEIVSADLPPEVKIGLLNQVERGDRSKEEAFNRPNFLGDEPLRTAVRYDDVRMTHALLARSANPNSLKNGTPILFDVSSVDIAKLVAAYGGNINAVDDADRSILFENAKRFPEDVAMATWAITEGVAINKKNIFGWTAYQEQLLLGDANECLKNEESAFGMARSMSGVGPRFLRERETGKTKLRKF